MPTKSFRLEALEQNLGVLTELQERAVLLTCYASGVHGMEIRAALEAACRYHGVSTIRLMRIGWQEAARPKDDGNDRPTEEEFLAQLLKEHPQVEQEYAAMMQGISPSGNSSL